MNSVRWAIYMYQNLDWKFPLSQINPASTMQFAATSLRKGLSLVPSDLETSSNFSPADRMIDTFTHKVPELVILNTGLEAYLRVYGSLDSFLLLVHRLGMNMPILNVYIEYPGTLQLELRPNVGCEMRLSRSECI
ncbi:hypothetical protein Tco_1167266 [Tanacetum coccineum]